MPLARCRKSYGYARTTARELRIFHESEVLFQKGGLYDWRGRLLPESASFAGVAFPGRPDFEPIQPRTAALARRSNVPRLNGRLHFWCGRLITHFGHFMLESLPRLWAVNTFTEHKPRFVFWGDAVTKLDGPEARFAIDILTACGVDRDDIVVVEEPVLIENVVVPESAFDMNLFGTEAFRRTCQSIGDQLIEKQHLSRRSHPIYLSKARLSGGISRIINEADFVARLEEKGVEIVYPESVSLAQQIGVWRSSPLVTGYLGSQTHTGIFSRGGSSIFINHEDQVFSNQLMIDDLRHADATYVYPEGDIKLLGRDKDFHLNFMLTDPTATADQFLRLIDGAMSRDDRSWRTPLPPPSIDRQAYFDEPLGLNLSLGKPASQSSVFPPHSRHADPVLEAAGAVSGTLPDDYAFHTQAEHEPWWQVDLGSAFEINEIRVYNRTLIGSIYARNFRISVSMNTEDWHTIFEKNDGVIFGEGDAPHRCIPTGRHIGRFVRITIPERAILHLKQVEVFGQHPISTLESYRNAAWSRPPGPRFG